MSTEKKKAKVTSTDDLRQALAAGYDASQIEFDNTAALAAAREEGVVAGKASVNVDEARAEATTAERERITAIHALARPGFDAEMKAAIDGGHAPEKFAMAVLTAAKDRGITLDAIKKDSPPPAAHAGGQGDADPDDATALLSAAMKTRNERSA